MNRRPLSGNPFSADLAAGAAVASLLIPQSLAYAELAGVPAHVGLYAAVLPPIAAAFFASSPYLQTGPVALTALLTFGALSAIAVPRTPEFIALAVLLALTVGVMRIAIGVLRWGWIAYLMSPPMMLGFTCAAGILIIASQLPAILGMPATAEVKAGALFALARPWEWQGTAIALAAGTMGLAMGARRVHPLFPGVLIAVGIGLLIGRYLGHAGPLVGEIAHVLPRLHYDVPWSRLPALLVPGAVIAIVGFAEPAAIARVYAAQERQRWSPDREFVAQGVANVASAAAGGFPVGGSFSRTALNHMAGGRTRWSGAMTGLIVLAVLPVAGGLSYLPRAVLGGIVIAAALKLISLRGLLDIARQSPLQGAVALITFALTLGLAPRIDLAVVAGIVLAAAVHIWRELEIPAAASVAGDTLTLTPGGVLFFASAPGLEASLLEQLSAHPEAKRLILRLGQLGRVDHSGAMVLRTVSQEAAAAGLEVRITEIPPQARRVLTRVMGADSPFLEPMVTGGGHGEPPDASSGNGGVTLS
jgi:sulfate permease, SulP family